MVGVRVGLGYGQQTGVSECRRSRDETLRPHDHEQPHLERVCTEFLENLPVLPTALDRRSSSRQCPAASPGSPNIPQSDEGDALLCHMTSAHMVVT